MSKENIKNYNNKAVNWGSDIDVFKGLSKKQIEVFKSIVWKQFDRGILIKPEYYYYNENLKDLIVL